jgi:hypothetical protein
MNKQETIEVLFGYKDGNGVFVVITPRPHNEDPRPAETELRESLETAKRLEKIWQEGNLAVQRRIHMCCSYSILA